MSVLLRQQKNNAWSSAASLTTLDVDAWSYLLDRKILQNLDVECKRAGLSDIDWSLFLRSNGRKWYSVGGLDTELRKVHRFNTLHCYCFWLSQHPSCWWTFGGWSAATHMLCSWKAPLPCRQQHHSRSIAADEEKADSLKLFGSSLFKEDVLFIAGCVLIGFT